MEVNFFFETSNGRLPLEHSSDSRQTLAKRDSDDLQTFIFRRRKIFLEFFFQKIISFFKKVTFWRSYEFLIRVGRCVVKRDCPIFPYFWGDFLGEGVNNSICVLDLDLTPKMTSTFWTKNDFDHLDHLEPK